MLKRNNNHKQINKKWNYSEIFRNIYHLINVYLDILILLGVIAPLVDNIFFKGWEFKFV